MLVVHPENWGGKPKTPAQLLCYWCYQVIFLNTEVTQEQFLSQVMNSIPERSDPVPFLTWINY